MTQWIGRTMAVIASLTLLSLAGAFFVSAAPARAPSLEGSLPAVAPAVRMTAATTITVNSTADDAADGKSKTCLNATPCTLRRAINQA